MTAIVELVFEVTVVFIFGKALVDYLKIGRKAYVEIPLVLGAMAVAAPLLTIGFLAGLPGGILTTVIGSLFLAQAYFLVLLARRFARVRALTLWFVTAGLLIAVTDLALVDDNIDIGSFIITCAFYLFMNAYAASLFLREMRTKRGVVPRRMLAIALATAAITLAALVLASPILIHLAIPRDHLIAAMLALVASVGYVGGFTPPGWLLRRWQEPEIASFIRGEPKARATDAALEHLGNTALRMTGARSVGIVETAAGAGNAPVRWYAHKDEPIMLGSQFEVPARGIVANAVVEGRPGVSRILEELPQDVRNWAVQFGIQEYTAVPIADEDRKIGVLLVLADRGFLFAQDDIDLLGQLAHHTAITVENVRLLSVATREAARLAAVNRVMEALIRPLDPDVLAREIVQALAEAVEVDVSELFTLDPDGLHLMRIARYPGDAGPMRWAAGEGIQGLALAQGRVILSEDVQGDRRFSRQEEALREGYRSAFTVPLLAQGSPVGAYILIHKHVHVYVEEERDVLRALTVPIAVALRNAILHSSAERRLQRFQALHESALALASELSMDDLLTQIADAARRLVGAGRAAVFVLDGSGGSGRFVASGLGEDERSMLGPRPTAREFLEYSLRSGTLRQGIKTTEPSAFAEGLPSARRFLEVPISYGLRVLGTFVLTDNQRGPEFSDEDERSLRALAAHAAVAITNATLFTSIDEARRAAEQANDDLAHANRAKSEFLASMSHELRTPLNAILGFTELMLDDDGIDLPRRRHYLETVHSSGSHLLSLINDILDLAKVEAGRMDLQPEDFDAPLAAREVLTAIQPLAEQGGIRVDLQAEPDLHVQADRGKFKQILYNLVSNAIKFTDQGGRVDVECLHGEGEFILAVTDTGIGIAPEDQQRIFDAFQQLHGTSERPYKGTGLGLALVRQFVELHGGRITLRSNLGEGSRFEVHLPLREGTALIEAAVAESAVEDTDAPLILVVEDDPRSEAILRHYLEGGGYRVVTARDGEDALLKARNLRPSAITLDVLLPGIDGWGVLEVLKSDPQTRDLPVVVVSVTDDPRRAYALGASDYFVKPVNREILLERLSRHTRLSSAQQTVLAVDDEKTDLDLMAGILRGAGYRVLEARSGREALDLVQRDPPDLIVLDLVMPELSGFAVLEELRRRGATRQVPVLVLTPRDLTAEDKRQLSGHALIRVLRKGVHVHAHLVEWVRFALRSKDREES